ncbi:MAG TPA: hypothetical protein PK590_05430 [Candidatus Omnitrophota bacterium]|nr:hypothetical protein [Candidatus Omnitrophota bacterium]
MGTRLGIFFAFILSLTAAGGAYYLYQHLTAERSIRIDLEKKYDTTRERVLNLQSEKEQIKAAKEQFEAESEDYRRKAQEYESQVSRLKNETSRIISARTDLEKQLQDKNSQVAEMEKKIVELQQKAEEAMRACNVTPADIKETLSQEEVLSSSTTNEGGLVFTSPGVTPARAPMAVMAVPQSEAVSPGISTVSTPTPPVPLDMTRGSKVLTVNRKFNFVVVNLGLKDGLKMGDSLKVIKSGRVSATLQVEKLYDKFAAATIVTEDQQIPVMEGDEVSKG